MEMTMIQWRMDLQWHSNYRGRRCSTRHIPSQDTSHARTTSDTGAACLHISAALYSPSLWCESCCHVASSTVELTMITHR